jgi:hypothetical protein
MILNGVCIMLSIQAKDIEWGDRIYGRGWALSKTVFGNTTFIDVMDQRGFFLSDFDNEEWVLVDR